MTTLRIETPRAFIPLMVKTCTRCKLSLGIENFAPSKKGKGGLYSQCRECVRAYDREKYARNPQAKAAAYKRYYAKSGADARSRNARRYAHKAEAIKAASAAYRAANRDKVYEWNGTRRAALRNAVPSWADRAAIKAIYREARWLSEATGVTHHVDHVIPLSGRNVCGLHVETNLAILTAAQNMAKGNRTS